MTRKKEHRMNKRNEKVNISGKRALIIFVSVFLALALVFAATLGIIAIVKSASSVVSYEGVTMTKPVASFFISRFKVEYISALRASGVNAIDTPAFWAAKDDTGATYGEIFRTLAEQYLKEIVATAYLFDRYSRLSSEDKERIEATCRDVLEYQAGADEDKFNEIAAKYGYDYGDFCDAVELLYKSTHSYAAIYGADGSGIYSDKASCEKYLSEYSHVQFIFIRTKQKLTTDGDGKPILVDLTAEQRQRREEVIATLSKAIDEIKTNGDGQMTPAMFEMYLEGEFNEGDTSMNATGYYLHENAETTAELAEAFPEVVKEALRMEVGEFSKVVTTMVDADNLIGMDGVCFIYKYAPVSGAYATPSLEDWFSDFYSDASEHLFAQSVSTLIADAKTTEKLSELDFIAIPKNTELVPRFE